MSDEQKKSLPAWQQSSQSEQSNNVSSPTSNTQNNSTESTATPSTSKVVAVPPDTQTAAATALPLPPSITPGVDSENEQRELIREFLKEVSVKDQSLNKKREFLQSKGMPSHLIEKELGSSSVTPFQESDIQSFQQKRISEVQPVSATETTSSMSAPPIITYPEFLANAHQASPLVTPGRVLATTYVASAAAALLYGASTFLVKPMTAQLTYARHEFAQHSQSKVDELNARLEKVVSQIPGAKIGTDYSDSDADSLASDPTELYHRDIGTQTDTSSSSKPAVQVAFVNNDSAQAHVDKLQSLEKELGKLLTGINAQGEAIREREESVSKLRHYLDSLAYSGNNIWSHNGVGYGWEANSTANQKNQEKKSDSIEDLKREIRGVKGVLLSAKRFPAAAQNGPANRYKAPTQTPA